MSDRQLVDEEKQILMLKEIGQQIKMLIISVVKILLIVSPFLLYIVFDAYYLDIGYDQFYSPYGILLSIIAIIFYLFMKRYYVRLFKN